MDHADLVLCAHVLYTIADVVPFIRKLEAHALERVLVVLFNSPPQSQLYSLWRQVHGVERLPLPSALEFQEVLRSLGIDARLEQLSPQSARGFDSPEQALAQLARRLFLSGTDPKRRILESILRELLEEEGGVYRIRGAEPLKPALLSWRPGG